MSDFGTIDCVCDRAGHAEAVWHFSRAAKQSRIQSLIQGLDVDATAVSVLLIYLETAGPKIKLHFHFLATVTILLNRSAKLRQRPNTIYSLIYAHISA